MPSDKSANDKQALLDKLEAAKLAKQDADSTLVRLSSDLEAARAAQIAADQAAEVAHAEAFAEEIAAAAATAKANELRHEVANAAHRTDIEKRRDRRGEVPAIDPTADIKVMTIDGKTHEVIAAHGLKLGHKGFGTKVREASRYHAACRLSIDAVHEELDHERFDQTKTADCPACATALADMKSGKIEDRRSDYLTADEQLAHARAEQKRKNAESSKSAESEPSS